MTKNQTTEKLRLEPEMNVGWKGGKSQAPRVNPEGTGPTIDQKAGRLPDLPAPGGNASAAAFHKRVPEADIAGALPATIRRLWLNILGVLLFSGVTNILVLAIPIYLFQISDRVLTSRSTDTLIMLTLVIIGAVLLQVTFDAIRRGMLLRSSVDLSARLGAPVLSAAARASLASNGQEYQTLGDLQQVRSFLVSGTLLSFLDLPFAPIFILAIFLVHPHLGLIVLTTALVLLVIAMINQRVTAKPFSDANRHLSKSNLHLDSMARNSQIINALAMIPEAVNIWGRDAATSMAAQVRAQDRNIIFAGASRGVRLLTQVGLLGWGAYLALQGEITGGMVIAASIIAGRALAPIEGAIEGWNSVLLSRAAYGRIATLLKSSPLNTQRLRLPHPEGRLDVERLLYVPNGTKRVVLNSIGFSLNPGTSLAIVGKSGAGKTTLGKMLVGSILPTSGSVRLDLMDLRNWDQRQLGQCIGYLPQDVQLFPGTIKDNIARMRADASDEEIYQAAVLADVHDMIAKLPEGYETIVAADGSPLSGGQKQRIGLARAFFGSPRLVVLDEPNSNLDTAGDQALSRAMALAKKDGMTVVVVTQKYSILKDVDNIMLLADGQIALFGARDQMLEKLSLQSRQGNGAAQAVRQQSAPQQPAPQPAQQPQAAPQQQAAQAAPQQQVIPPTPQAAQPSAGPSQQKQISPEAIRAAERLQRAAAKQAEPPSDAQRSTASSENDPETRS
ncbi:type I secretion system permease/ATPase [Paracoccus aerodenitrificans]|uniref:type I secretion system permease/ATPase n=1 Tax=Paracoccus aerodenitrificans TaxID=3017781 RepID=UPI0022EFF799|nr:type I secretion system permease/ATPase [Paracoccus aerodenitrificans]WBU64445.1 type I secretion system permease/ATPase [Paracoccus aerodenitrificans]